MCTCGVWGFALAQQEVKKPHWVCKEIYGMHFFPFGENLNWIITRWGIQFNCVFRQEDSFSLSSQLELIMCYERIFSSYNKQGHKPQSKKVINHRGAFQKKCFSQIVKAHRESEKSSQKNSIDSGVPPKSKRWHISWIGRALLLYTHTLIPCGAPLRQ